jgi:hypothetical protein
MAKYQVHMFCNECGQTHPFPIGFEMVDGPPTKAAVGDVYDGIELPPQLATMVNNSLQCPVTGRLTTQKDNNQVFLVPIA